MTITPKTLDIIRERAAGLCERCYRSPDTNSHHRRPRGLGGSRDPDTDLPANLLRLCGSGTTGCHGWIEHHRTTSIDLGYLIQQGKAPSTVPVLLVTHGFYGWYLLDNDGNRTPCCACGTSNDADTAHEATAHLRLYDPGSHRGAYRCRQMLVVTPDTKAVDIVPSARALAVNAGTGVQVEIRHHGNPEDWAMVTASDDSPWLAELRDDNAVKRLRGLA